MLIGFCIELKKMILFSAPWKSSFLNNFLHFERLYILKSKDCQKAGFWNVLDSKENIAIYVILNG